jgi:hypothetical protein
VAEGFERIAGPVTATSRLSAIRRRERQRRGRRDAFVRNREAELRNVREDEGEKPRIGRYIDEEV